MFRRENERSAKGRLSGDAKRVSKNADRDRDIRDIRDIEKELKREFEKDLEERAAKQRETRRRTRTPLYDDYDDDPRLSRGAEPMKRKVPMMLRLLAWCGVVLFCFVVGYMGTSYVLLLMDKQSLLKPDVFNGEDEERTERNARGGAAAFLSSDNTELARDSGADMQKTTVTIYYPKDGTLLEEKLDVIAQTREDNIQEIVLKLLERSGFFGKDVYIKHVFRNVDTVYIDFSAPFLQSLSASGAKVSALLVTGIVRTMRDNFQPIDKVRFLVDSKIATSGAPIDLTATWQLPK
ncbi:hypothetical protein FACS1894187_06570 [Synergistales bacterium]|nr:hypothetical protein FACS1894187_06570 [Synergistales bacterium]